FRFKADLRAGKNLVVVMVDQGGGPWEFSVAVATPGTGRLFRAAGKAADPTEYAAFAAATAGNPGRGRAGFADLQGAACARCPVTGPRGETGGDGGPSRAGVGAKYDRRQLIEAVLYPSKQILDGYQQTRVVTADGQVRVGIIRGETPDEITLLDAD